MVDIAVMPLPVGGGHQHGDILAQHVAFGILEHALRGRAERHDRAAHVDDDQRVRDGRQDGAEQCLFQAVLALRQAIGFIVRYRHADTMPWLQCASKSGTCAPRGMARVTPPNIISRTRLWPKAPIARSEENTSELQSLMRHTYAVFC